MCPVAQGESASDSHAASIYLRRQRLPVMVVNPLIPVSEYGAGLSFFPEGRRDQSVLTGATPPSNVLLGTSMSS